MERTHKKFLIIPAGKIFASLQINHISVIVWFKMKLKQGKFSVFDPYEPELDILSPVLLSCGAVLYSVYDTNLCVLPLPPKLNAPWGNIRFRGAVGERWIVNNGKKTEDAPGVLGPRPIGLPRDDESGSVPGGPAVAWFCCYANSGSKTLLINTGKVVSL